jgi:hypothetical protein
MSVLFLLQQETMKQLGFIVSDSSRKSRRKRLLEIQTID